MQNHYDRDQYIQVIWDNINDDNLYNFDKVSSRLYSNFGTDYDMFSIMHYDPFSFSRNGRRTIVPYDDKYRDIIGQRTALSKGDVLRLQNMYECT